IINTDKAPAPVGPYSQAVRVGDFLYCSGQVAIDPATNEVKKGSVAEQTELVMSNIKAVLNEAGADFSNVFKTMIFILDMKDFATVNEIYAKYFSEEPPARSCVAVAQLPKGLDVEIEVIAKL
ncbi:MAG: RidA family protein, partial [Methylococcales bacterium]|nr:RidA family protein [Methylococcales bacterium]